jgi:hypothetical protein
MYLPNFIASTIGQNLTIPSATFIAPKKIESLEEKHQGFLTSLADDRLIIVSPIVMRISAFTIPIFCFK